MKIIFVASKYDYGNKERGYSFERENFYPALDKYCDELIEFDFISITQQTGMKEMNYKLKELVIQENPDIIFFVLTNNEFERETLEFIKNHVDGVSINWFCDDQWRFDTFSQYYSPFFNYIITTDKLAVNKYKNIGVENVILSQWACSLEKEINFDTITYSEDVTFIGQKNEYREWFVKYLKQKGINVACYGYGWQNGKISFNQMQDIFLKSKINLNISNSFNYDIRYVLSSPKPLYKYLKNKIKHNLKDVEQIKARHFEIAGAGGFQLTNYVPFLEDYFHIGQNIQIYSDLNDIIDKIKYYLDNEKERMYISRNGYKLISEKHNYFNRVEKILEFVMQDYKRSDHEFIQSPNT